LLSQVDNERLCRTDTGTPMGTLMRRFWMPALLAEELPEPDCPPVRVRLLAEDLVAFRDSTGQVGLVAENCPHRGASLFFGRNEEGGLRCVYHGWKFDAAGSCLDMPNEPPESNFRSKVRVAAYPCLERGGIVWTYLGPIELTPELPDLEWMHVPAEQRAQSKMMYEANYLQTIEGEIDTVHSSFLHSQLDYEGKQKTATELHRKYRYSHRWAKFVLKPTDGGLLIGAYRPAEDDSYYWRITNWLLPFHTLTPRNPGAAVRGAIWVPRDDESTWMFLVVWHPDRAPTDSELSEVTWCRDLMPGTWLPRFNRTNDYMVNRAEQRRISYSGIPRGSGRAQDAAMVESMGPIYDRTREHLGTTDVAIIAMRRRLLYTLDELDRGIEPYAAHHGELYRVRGGSAVLPRDVAFPDEDAEVLRDITALQRM
jgi:phenylpropionate dioxygenase-like ring-hydroxylating dioxygenase large terminal subunit